MTDYSKADPVLYEFAKSHGLFVLTVDRDWEVRRVPIIDDAACGFQLQLEPASSGGFTVAVWDQRDRHEAFEGKEDDLAQRLERAYESVESWIHEHGHTRTPVL